MGTDVKTLVDRKSSDLDILKAFGDLVLNVAVDINMLDGGGELLRGGELGLKGTEEVLTHGDTLLHGTQDALSHLGCSFTSRTLVATSHGHQAIGTLHVGDKVLAYNPRTHKMELQPILHVWIHSDNDLVDLTITTSTKGHHGASSPSKSEVVHTNQKYPFLTTEHGFLPVKQITVGMQVVRADGRTGVITKWTIVPGVKMMYNLEVAQDHTFTVGDGQWVVHNCGSTLPQQAEIIARGIGDNIVASEGAWSRKAITVGTAIVEDNGSIRTLLATNEKASSSLVKYVQEAERQGVGQLISLPDKQGRHAEEVLVEYAKNNGLNVLGLGASNNFCDRCGALLVQELGQLC